MSWERRRPEGGLYYTRNRQSKGRRIRVYLGCGPEAEAAAAEDQLRQAARRLKSAAREAEEARWRGTSDEVNRLSALIALVTKATMLCAGFRPNNGDWNIPHERE